MNPMSPLKAGASASRRSDFRFRPIIANVPMLRRMPPETPRSFGSEKNG